MDNIFVCLGKKYEGWETTSKGRSKINIGDYWEILGVKWRVVEIRDKPNKNEVIIVPDTVVEYPMDSSGELGFYTKETIQDIFGRENTSSIDCLYLNDIFMSGLYPLFDHYPNFIKSDHNYLIKYRIKNENMYVTKDGILRPYGNSGYEDNIEETIGIRPVFKVKNIVQESAKPTMKDIQEAALNVECEIKKLKELVAKSLGTWKENDEMKKQIKKILNTKYGSYGTNEDNSR